MGITYGDHLIDSGYYDITPEQERAIEEQAAQERELDAREECDRRGIDPDEFCADGGVTAWMVVAKEMSQRNRAANLCSDCPPVGYSTDRTRCLPCPRRASVEPSETEPHGTEGVGA